MIGDAQTVVDRLYAWVDEPKAQQRTNTSRRPASSSLVMGDHEIILRARNAKNGTKFAALFDHGDTSAYGGDHSRAEMALLAILSFYTQDPVQLDRLYRASALARAKWDERHRSDGATYGQMTIEACLANISEVYNPSRVEAEAGEDEQTDPTDMDMPQEPPDAAEDGPSATSNRDAQCDGDADIAALQAECQAWRALHANRTLSQAAKVVLPYVLMRLGYYPGQMLPETVPLGFFDTIAKECSGLGATTFDRAMAELEERGVLAHVAMKSATSGRPYYLWSINGTVLNKMWATLATEQPPASSAENLAEKQAEKERRRQERADRQHREERLSRRLAEEREAKVAAAQAIRDRDAEIDELEGKTASLAAELDGAIIQLEEYRKATASGVACSDCGATIDLSAIRCDTCRGFPQNEEYIHIDYGPQFGKNPVPGALTGDADLLAGLEDALTRVSALEDEKLRLIAEVDWWRQHAGALKRLNGLYAAKNGALAIRLEQAAVGRTSPWADGGSGAPGPDEPPWMQDTPMGQEASA